MIDNKFSNILKDASDEDMFDILIRTEDIEKGETLAQSLGCESLTIGDKLFIKVRQSKGTIYLTDQHYLKISLLKKYTIN